MRLTTKQREVLKLAFHVNILQGGASTENVHPRTLDSLERRELIFFLSPTFYSLTYEGEQAIGYHRTTLEERDRDDAWRYQRRGPFDYNVFIDIQNRNDRERKERCNYLSDLRSGMTFPKGSKKE